MADSSPQMPPMPPMPPMHPMEEAVKTIEVEPAPEGPKVKPKRVLTPAQLEALRKGRERLAEIRRVAKEEDVTEAKEAKDAASAEAQSNEYESSQQDSWCAIM
jgi:hypothetical protein